MRKGLFIGINHYDHVSPLSGCSNDAMAMASVLERHANGRPNFSSKVLTSAEEKLTLNHMKQQIQSLFSGDCDVALLYFAGHGQFDTSIDEGLLIPQDYQPGGDGIRISDILEWADKAPHIKNKIIILDCCQAGAAGAVRNLRGGSSVIGEGVTILTACKRTVRCGESRSWRLHGSVAASAARWRCQRTRQSHPGSVYSFVDNALGAWEQRPVFKTNVSQFVPLRGRAADCRGNPAQTQGLVPRAKFRLPARSQLRAHRSAVRPRARRHLQATANVQPPQPDRTGGCRTHVLRRASLHRLPPHGARRLLPRTRHKGHF